jgi:hypothetical protein
MSESTVTIESLEALAAEIEAGETQERAKLRRLIAAYARIVAGRDPGQFKRMPLEYSDEDGHWDNSYPPEQRYKQHTGPRLIEVETEETAHIATSRGFYHDYRVVTESKGLYVRCDGALLGCEVTGTGSLGQYAAHPGDCAVMCELDWQELEADEISAGSLRRAERHMRDLAFPLIAAAKGN